MLTDLQKKFQEFRDQQKELDAAGIDSRVLFIDGTNTYIRCFAASPQMDDNGEHIGGVIGFLKSVGLAIRQFRPSRVVMVFDGKGGSQRRRQLYPEYKAGRKTMNKLNRSYDFTTIEDEKMSMRQQMALLVEMLDHLPVNVFAVDNIEADDTIGYLSEIVQERGGTSIIFSTDKDFIQLVGNTCQVYNPVSKVMYTPEEVQKKYLVHPDNFLIYRMIEGDKSDNITGVDRVAKKTILNNFPYLADGGIADISRLIEDCYDDKGKFKNKACERIHEAHEEGILERNRQLMTLSDVNISGTTKIKILDHYNAKPHTFNKMGLTNTLVRYRLQEAFGNYDSWVSSTWIPLTRFK